MMQCCVIAGIVYDQLLQAIIAELWSIRNEIIICVGQMRAGLVIYCLLNV